MTNRESKPAGSSKLAFQQVSHLLLFRYSHFSYLSQAYTKIISLLKFKMLLILSADQPSFFSYFEAAQGGRGERWSTTWRRIWPLSFCSVSLMAPTDLMVDLKCNFWPLLNQCNVILGKGILGKGVRYTLCRRLPCTLFRSLFWLAWLNKFS